MTGTIQGEAIEQTLDATWTLAARFLELHFAGTKSPEPGMPPYEARVLVGYDEKAKRYVGYWLDVFGAGASAVGVGERKGDALVVVYDYPTAEFRNTFTPSPDGTWRLLIESRAKHDAKATWQVFADEKLTRSR